MTEPTLASLGWSESLARQAGPDDTPARVAAVQRDRLSLLGAGGGLSLPVHGSTGAFAVGDWVLHDGTRVTRRLTPRTEIARRVAGTTSDRQLIAANVDTLGIVTSCNADFNLARLERYLAIALSAGCLPLVILTKADLCADPAPYLRQAQRLSPLVTALALNAMDGDDIARLTPWAGPGQTLALVGSSGVGKTTLRNALTGESAVTQGIREDDARGRHTTTYRALVPTLAGGCLIDTPGMRELRLTEAADGIEAAFDDIATFARGCRFHDCAHDSEPGCAVQAAIADGRLDPARLTRLRKLEREDRHQTEALHERHARFRAFARRAAQGRARSEAKRHIPDDAG